LDEFEKGFVLRLADFKQIILQLTVNQTTTNKNKAIYESTAAPNAFLQTELQEPEKTILTTLTDKLPTMHMLDIGVGCGRTTCHFAPLVKEYIGVDYAHNMVAICQNKFRPNPLWSFLTVDARDLLRFEEDYFDFVLFSFNGIDYVSHVDRLRILQQIRRVVKIGGFFCFSSHNLGALDCSTHLSRHPLVMFRQWTNLLLMRILNGRCWKTMRSSQKQRHVIIKDGVFNYALLTYYITLSEQIKQLTDAGFCDIGVYGFDGIQVKTAEDAISPWLYYLTRAA
jgi:ubiquinone/menaquinone biosynthesis C-methylase UbiE